MNSINIWGKYDFKNIVTSILYMLGTCSLTAIPASDMETYRKELPIVDTVTRQIVDSTALISHDGFCVIDANGERIVISQLYSVGKCIEIKSAKELFFITSYFLDQDYKMRGLAIISIITLLERNKLGDGLEYDHNTFKNPQDIKFLKLTKDILNLLPKIKAYD